MPVYTATAGQTNFPYTFAIQNAADLKVRRTRDGVTTQLVLNTHYTVTNVGVAGGGDVVTAPSLEDDLIKIDGLASISRTQNVTREGKFRSTVTDAELDRQTIWHLETRRLIDEFASGGLVGDATLAAQIEALAAAIGAPPTLIKDFASRAAAILATVDPLVTHVRTAGYASPGDGGAALYKLAVSEPLHPGKFQSEDGAWWELVEETPSPLMFGAVADGVTAADAPFADLMAYLYARRISGTYQHAISEIRIPRGKLLLTSVGVLSAAFASLTEGVHFIGDGPGSSELIYDNASADADNHALDSGKMRRVAFENMKITVVQSTSKFIKWYNAGGGSGSYFLMRNVNVEGSYARFFDVAGTTLGSETYWDFVSGTVPEGGVFFYVASTNPQSLNHLFQNCSLAIRGTLFEFNAGGNLKWFGGYSSMWDGATFIKTRGTGAVIGTSNKDYSFYGWHPETVSGETGDIKLVDAQQGSFCFERCNFSQLVTTAGVDQIVIISGVAQKATSLTFRDCLNPKRVSIDDQCDLMFDGCEMPAWDSIVTSYTRGAATNFLSPRIRVVNRKNGPDADPFFFERDVGAAYHIAPVYAATQLGRTSALKRLLWRFGTSGTSAGLTVQQGGAYGAAVNTVDTIPLGSIVARVTIVFLGGTASFPSSARKLKLENFDGSVTYSLKALAVDDSDSYETEKTFNGDEPGVFVTPDLWHRAYDADAQLFKAYMALTGGSGGSTSVDYGYIMVDYY